MATTTRRTVRVHDTDVKLRRPVLAGLLCLLTLGISGAVHHHRMTRDIQRFGRARGTMPFPFIPVQAGASTLGWIAGLLCWWGFVAAVVGFAVAFGDGYDPVAGDITTFASAAALLGPAWIVASHTIRRIRTVRHLVGTPGTMPSPIVGAALATLLPPIGSWNAQRQLNRAWREWQE